MKSCLNSGFFRSFHCTWLIPIKSVKEVHRLSRFFFFSVTLICLCSMTGCTPSTESGSVTEAGSTTASISDELQTPATTGVSFHPGDTITVKVPEMHCPFYCYPKVEETLTDLGGIKKIELVKQKSEDKIDDPRIILEFNGDFDWDTATKALEEAGFAGATVVAGK